MAMGLAIAAAQVFPPCDLPEKEISKKEEMRAAFLMSLCWGINFMMKGYLFSFRGTATVLNVPSGFFVVTSTSFFLTSQEWMDFTSLGRALGSLAALEVFSC